MRLKLKIRQINLTIFTYTSCSVPDSFEFGRFFYEAWLGSKCRKQSYSLEATILIIKPKIKVLFNYRLLINPVLITALLLFGNNSSLLKFSIIL